MKTQVTLVPETILEVVNLIVAISSIFGLIVLYLEVNMFWKNEEGNTSKLYNFAQVFIGDRCVLYENIKGILDYNKIKNKNTCIENFENGINIIIDNEKIIYNKDCENFKEKLILPTIVVKNSKYIEAKLLAC